MSRSLLLLPLLFVASPALAREKEIHPYIEVGQVVAADLNGGDVLTYTTVGAGIDASLQTRRTQVQISYRYEHRFSYDDRLADSDVHSGLARAAVRVLPALTIEGGALATRTRADIRGAAPGLLAGNVANVSQLYSFYAGPTFGTSVGPLGVSAAYRYGYTRLEAPSITAPLPGQPRDLFSDARTQQAQASVNLRSGVLLPVGITVSGAWQRDDAGQLNQVYDGRYGRVDVLWPVLPTLALTAGAGYEKIEISQQRALLNAGGAPVVDSGGRFVTDPTSPRQIAYDFDGIYYDAGVIWRPTSRTNLEIHAGRRYGSFTAFGVFSFQPSKSIALRVAAYDGIQTFGRQLQSGIAALPTAFSTIADPLGESFNGCVFGTSGGAAGGCLNAALQSATAAAYRARGVDAIISLNRGPTSLGIGAGYANRTFVTGSGVPGVTLIGSEDQSAYVQAYFARQLGPRMSVNGTVFGSYYLPGTPGAFGLYTVGANGSIGWSFGRLFTGASLGVYTNGGEGRPTVTSVQGQVNARYVF